MPYFSASKPLLAAVGVISFMLAGAASRSQAQPSPHTRTAGKTATPAQAAAGQAGASYVGADTCKACHEAEYDSWSKSPHWVTSENTRGGQAKQGCEACHGPGSAHIQDPSDKSKIFTFAGYSAHKISDRCLSCHASGQEQMNFNHSAMAESKVSCLDCHSIHHAQVAHYLLAKAQPELCYTCHQDKRAQFNMPVHHRVNEGLVKCTDCHNPHGTFQQMQLRSASAQDAVCFKCHIDKRGPFVFEHEAVKTEGCTACHTPHGSPNPHLLKFSNVNLICMQCHTASSFSGAPGIPSFHNQAAQYQACTMCHTQIHGSNFDQFFFK